MMTKAPIRESTARCVRLLAWLVLVLAMPAWAATAPASTPAPAAAPEDTYGVVVPVPDTTTAERGKAFVQALEQVLARVAGHPVSNAPGPAEAASFVERYRYQKAPPGAAQPFELDVHFAPDSVHHLLRSLVTATAQPVATPTASGTGSGVLGTGVATAAVTTSLWISGIQSGEDFARALHALTSTLGVEDVAVSLAQGDGMLADLATSLPAGQLVQTLQADGHFTVAPPHVGAATSLAWKP